jgi:hypothetical protein
VRNLDDGRLADDDLQRALAVARLDDPDLLIPGRPRIATTLSSASATASSREPRRPDLGVEERQTRLGRASDYGMEPLPPSS